MCSYIYIYIYTLFYIYIYNPRGGPPSEAPCPAPPLSERPEDGSKATNLSSQLKQHFHHISHN